jgi:hypothetical protein
VFSSWSVPMSYTTRTPVELQSVVKDSVKLRLGGWREMAARPAVSEFVKRGHRRLCAVVNSDL